MTREQIRNESAWLFDKMQEFLADDYANRAYYQGRLDALAWLMSVEKIN